MTRMTEQQFLLMQSAVQWAADEHDRAAAHVPADGVGWFQGAWAEGFVDPTIMNVAHGGEQTAVHELQMTCESACCLAGAAVRMAGARIVVGHFEGIETYDGDTSEEGKLRASWCLTADGRMEHISTYARELFGLTQGQAEMLFHPENELDSVIECATYFARGAGFELAVQRKDDVVR